MTDSELILQYLEHHPGWQGAAQMMRDLKPGAVGWAMRSRISCDLNKRILPPKGLIIESRHGANGMAEYRLSNVGVKLPSPITYDNLGQGTFV